MSFSLIGTSTFPEHITAAKGIGLSKLAGSNTKLTCRTESKTHPIPITTLLYVGEWKKGNGGWEIVVSTTVLLFEYTALILTVLSICSLSKMAK